MPAKLEPGGSGQPVVIDGRSPLIDTGVEVKPGQVYRIDVSQPGRWWHVLGRRGALAAQVGRGGARFHVREGERFEAPADGILYLFHRASWYSRMLLPTQGDVRRVR